jgi:hypothetical protein
MNDDTGRRSLAADVTWYADTKTSVIVRLSTAVNWEEFHWSVSKAHSLIRQVTHPVNLIIVAPGHLPSGNPILQFRSAFSRQPPNTGRLFVVAPPSPILGFTRRLASIMNSLYPGTGQIEFVSSLAEVDEQLKS